MPRGPCTPQQQGLASVPGWRTPASRFLLRPQSAVHSRGSSGPARRCSDGASLPPASRCARKAPCTPAAAATPLAVARMAHACFSLPGYVREAPCTPARQPPCSTCPDGARLLLASRLRPRSAAYSRAAAALLAVPGWCTPACRFPLRPQDGSAAATNRTKGRSHKWACLLFLLRRHAEKPRQ